MLIAQEMNLPPERPRLVALDGILHDIGKIGIPDAILNKPDRLTLEARIIAVADTFEALTSRRSYRAAFDCEVADEIPRHESGTHLDPEIVDVWLRIADRWFRQPRPTAPSGAVPLTGSEPTHE